MAKNLGEISLVTTTLNEEGNIVPLLRSVLKQEVLPKEVIVVDGGSKDKTVKEVRDFINANPSSNIYLFELPGTIGKCRNYGIEKAHYENIFSTDASCFLEKYAIKNALHYLKRYPVVGGVYVPKPASQFEKTYSSLYILDWSKTETPSLYSNRCLAFKKWAWKKVGGYREDIKRSEDTAISIAWRKKKIPTVFTKKMIIFYKSKRDLWDECKLTFKDVLRDHRLGLAKEISTYKKLYLVTTFLFVSFCVLVISRLVFLVLLSPPLVYIVYRSLIVWRKTKSQACFLYAFPVQVCIEASRVGGLIFFLLTYPSNKIKRT